MPLCRRCSGISVAGLTSVQQLGDGIFANPATRGGVRQTRSTVLATDRLLRRLCNSGKAHRQRIAAE